MDKNLGILGGDLRNAYLSKIFAKDGYKVYTYGIENFTFNNLNIIKCNELKEVSSKCNVIISGIPFSKDGININAPFSNKKIGIKNALEDLYNKKLIAGAIENHIKEKACKNKIDVIDLMRCESFTVLNIIPTVEGAIQVAMENTEITIHNSNCLVLGFGRIGKLLSKALKELGASVSCMARKNEDLAWINAYGYNAIHINDLSENLNNKNIIFNTIPAIVLDDKELQIIEKQNDNTVIIDLASSPGGLDFEKTKKYNIKALQAQGLPGKVAPITAAKYIKYTIEKILK